MPTMKAKILLSVCACALMLSACYKDLGNYDYKPTNTIDFSGAKPAIATATFGIRYTHTPQLAFATPEKEGEFDFWWECIGTGSPFYNYIDTVSLGKTLDFVPNRVGGLQYRLCAKEKSTGITTSSTPFTITISSLMSKGWVVLSELSSRSSLSLIAPAYQMEGTVKKRVYTEFKDVYHTLWGSKTPLGTGPIAVRQALNNSSSMMVIQNSGTFSLNGDSWEKTVDLNREFAMQSYPEGFVPKDFFYGTRIDALLDQRGYVYTRNYRQQGEYMSLFHTTFFSSMPEEVDGKKIVIDKFLPTIVVTAGFYGMVDNTNGRILWMRGLPANEGVIFKSRMTATAGQVDVNNFNGYTLLFGSGYAAASNASNFAMVFRKGDEVKIQRIKATWEAANYIAAISDVNVATLSAATANITDQTCFFMPKMSADYMFYATGNQLYLFTFATGVSTAIYPAFASGEKIVGLTANPQESELGLGFESGKVVILNIKPDINQITQAYAGSGYGAIREIVYKYNTYNVYRFGTAD